MRKSIKDNFFMFIVGIIEIIATIIIIYLFTKSFQMRKEYNNTKEDISSKTQLYIQKHTTDSVKIHELDSLHTIEYSQKHKYTVKKIYMSREEQIEEINDMLDELLEKKSYFENEN